MKPTPLIHHNYAPFGRRALACILDNLIFSPFLALFFVPDSWRTTVITIGVWTMVMALIFEGLKGWSFGRWLTRTRVVDIHTGKHIGVVRDFVRNNVHVIELAVAPWSYLRPLWNQHCMTFGDAIMSTVVIYVPKQHKSNWKPVPQEDQEELPVAA